MSDLEARIAEVVGAHVPSGTIVACGGCSHDRHDLDNGDGSQVDTWDARWHDFADHLAEVLAPVIREAQAEAWGDCVHVYDSMVCLDCEPNAPTNPYRADNLATP